MTDSPEKAALKRIQASLRDAGFYTGEIDGIWLGLSDGALREALAAARLRNDATMPEPPPAVVPARSLAWGKKVDQAFRDSIFWIADELGLPEMTGPDDLMSCIAWESGETFSPSVVNMAGSGATGLIQFMPTTAVGLKTTTAKLAAMTPVQQLAYVYRYFLPWKGKLRNLGDLYMAILWPLGVGKADSFVLWEKGSRPTTYRQNAGLDVNNDKRITRGEAVSKVLQKVAKGRLPDNLWLG